MSAAVTIPCSAEILQRIKDCREEMAALKKLLRASEATEKANAARQRRKYAEGKGGNHAP